MLQIHQFRSDFPRDTNGHLVFNSSALLELRSERPAFDLGLGGWYGTGQGPLNHFKDILEIKLSTLLHVNVVRLLSHVCTN